MLLASQEASKNCEVRREEEEHTNIQKKKKQISGLVLRIASHFHRPSTEVKDSANP